MPKDASQSLQRPEARIYELGAIEREDLDRGATGVACPDEYVSPHCKVPGRVVTARVKK
jgi:hypothetical protein